MRSRAIRLALIVALGVGIGLLIVRPWRGDTDVEPPLPVTAAPPANSTAPASAVNETSDSVPSPPPRTFNLPKMAPPLPAVVEKPKPAPILVPRHWLLRGTGPEGYDVKSNREEVFSGQASVMLASHTKNIAATKFASLMQTIVADEFVGKRVEFSMSAKSPDLRRHLDLWIRATDSGGAVIAHDHAESLYAKADWNKVTLVMDIPWSAAEIAYGINLQGAGAMWVDQAQFKVVDKAIPATGKGRPSELGVIVQTADRNGPLPAPSNLDFEDAIPVPDSFRELPKDELGKSRF